MHKSLHRYSTSRGNSDKEGHLEGQELETGGRQRFERGISQGLKNEAEVPGRVSVKGADRDWTPPIKIHKSGDARTVCSDP